MIKFSLSEARSIVSISLKITRWSSSFTSRKALDVAVIGAPNVGKSLLTNHIIRAAVSAVSSKMDTTTQNCEAVLTEDGVQLCVIDSPGTIGLAHARDVMGRSSQDKILRDPEEAIRRSQHILVIQDATAVGDYIHHRVMHLLHRHSHIPSSLVFNKVDLVTQRSDLLELTRILTNGRVGGTTIKTAKTTIGRFGLDKTKVPLHNSDLKENDDEWMEKYRNLISKPTHLCSFAETKRLFIDTRGYGNFCSVFFVSALTGEGVDTLRSHLKNLSEERHWRMDEHLVTNKSPQRICEESIRAALLDTVPSDVAYKLKPIVIEWREEGEVLQVVGEISVDKEKWGRLVLGKGGGRIAEIGKRVNDHMATLFQRQLFVRILVKHKEKVIDLSSLK